MSEEQSMAGVFFGNHFLVEFWGGERGKGEDPSNTVLLGHGGWGTGQYSEVERQ